MACKLFTRPYCGKQLQWLLLQDEVELDSRAPDVVFQDDPSFSPLTEQHLDQQQQQALHSILRGWKGGSSSLQQLIGVLLDLYAQHNKARIAAAVTDERVLFELSMLDELGCKEVLLTGGDGTGPQQVRFSLPVPADLAPAQQLLSCVRKLAHHSTPSSSSSSSSQQRVQQQQQQQQLDPSAPPQQEQQFTLTVAFAVAPGGGSSHIPVLQLKAPDFFSSQLPPMSLPAWDAHTSLLEYIPLLAERVTKHLSDHCPTAANRFQLFEGLSKLLGSPLEVNMMLLQSSSSSSSTSAAASPSSRARITAAATGSAAGVWQVLFDNQPLLLLLELPRSYPTNGPVLRLQNLRRTGSESWLVLQDLPWSPRWPVDEQVARLFNFLKLQAAKACVAEAAAAAAAGAGSGLLGSISPAAAAAASSGAVHPGSSSLQPFPGSYM